MIKLKLDYIELPEGNSLIRSHNLHRVYLGNNTSFVFERETLAKKFLLETSDTVNDWLIISNTCLIDCYCSYRKLWPLIDNGRVTARTKRDFKGLATEALQHFVNAEKMLDRLPRFSGIPKANYYIINGFMGVLRELLAMVETLAPFVKLKLDAVRQNEARQLAKKISDLLNEIETYGHNHPNRVAHFGMSNYPKPD